jgi:hypothetical protein
VLFIEIAEGLDAATWDFHRRRGDCSRWFEQEIGDAGLAADTRAIEQDGTLDAAQSLAGIRAAIQARYTQPENPSLPAVLTSTHQNGDRSQPRPPAAETAG